LGKSGLSHPEELGFDRCETVLRVIVGTADEIQELAVELGGGRGHNFEIGEDSVLGELFCDLAEQLPLSPIFEVVNGESGDNGVK
jgi:hypothetical protein